LFSALIEVVLVSKNIYQSGSCLDFMATPEHTLMNIHVLQFRNMLTRGGHDVLYRHAH